MLRLELNHVSKKGPRSPAAIILVMKIQHTFVFIEFEFKHKQK